MWNIEGTSIRNVEKDILWLSSFRVSIMNDDIMGIRLSMSEMLRIR